MSRVVAFTGAVVCEEIRIHGTVQGVGFRPFVYRLAHECALYGEVLNDAGGLCIRVSGHKAQIDSFLQRIESEMPPLAAVEHIERRVFDGALQDGFSIVGSVAGTVRTSPAPDAATCPQCLADITDPANRRAGYPFTNCTHCGPRLSIIDAIPYDRESTSMRSFEMCDACRSEYEDPSNRRFHAQPNACEACGPHVWFHSDEGAEQQPNISRWLERTVEYLRAGKILAIKGIGGFHLACAATDESAVQRLRQRKRRYEKPFALLARDVKMVRAYCELSETEEALLESPAAPIVILHRSGPKCLVAGVADHQAGYGFMLPYSPLHHLIMRHMNEPIVLTSGNVSDEPQCTDNDGARSCLTEIADDLLLHDRDIVNRLDDSVVRVIGGKPQILRRARGYAPAGIRLPDEFEDCPKVLALGGELKNTFCLIKDGSAIVSPHLGNLANRAAYDASCETIELFEKLFQFTPNLLAVDRHPDYLSTKYGRQRAKRDAIEVFTVQHHHAHIAACLVDNQVPLHAPPVLGIALDGLGLGDDGTLWGGEFLLADYCRARRVASFEPVQMPGGSKAITEPWRMAFAYLRHNGGYEELAGRYASLPFFQYLETEPVAALDRAMTRRINCPETSACGRIFDAVASILGLRQVVSYEAQGALELEALLANAGTPRSDTADLHGYQFSVRRQASHPMISTAPLWEKLLDELAQNVPAAIISQRFHGGLAAAIVEMANELTEQHCNPWRSRIALSGGVFQNKYLTELLLRGLTRSGFEVYTHVNVPANDGGLSLGQAVVAAARTLTDAR